MLRTLGVLSILLLPLALAHEPTHDEAVALPGEDDPEAVYVVACRAPNRLPAPGPLVSDCLDSGVWTEANGWHGAQTRAGTFENEDGRTLAYQADARALP